MNWEVVALVCVIAGCLMQAAAFLRLAKLKARGERPGGRLVAGLQLAAMGALLAWVAASIAAHR